ncbi:MAG: phosphatase PAP2 family protein [Thermoguttaceae bacterium]|jgi:membrane-associated phospholipid phosphatase
MRNVGNKLRFPAPEALERYIPYLFLAAWSICGAAVFAGALLSEGRRSDQDRTVARVVHYATAGTVSGYLAAGVVVSVLSVAHCCARRLLGSKDLPAASGPDLTESRLRLLYLGFLLSAAAALSIDCSLSQWCVARKCPSFLHGVLEPFAAFGDAAGTFVVLFAIHRLDPSRRRRLWWVLACVLLSALAANGAKTLLARTRPQNFDFHYGVCTTFGRWLPVKNVSQSLPSGHTATAAGLALALMALYPRGRRLFLLLAVLVACQRIESGAHFLSDVLSGAGVSCLTVACCLRLDRWFTAPSTQRHLP